MGWVGKDGRRRLRGLGIEVGPENEGAFSLLSSKSVKRKKGREKGGKRGGRRRRTVRLFLAASSISAAFQIDMIVPLN